MINKIFTVYDEKAQAYLPPFYFHQEAQARRVFTDTINSKDHQFGNHPADYTLFHIGEFDDNTAQIEPIVPVSLGNGVEYIAPDNQPDMFNANQISNDPSGQSSPEGGNSA